MALSVFDKLDRVLHLSTRHHRCPVSVAVSLSAIEHYHVPQALRQAPQVSSNFALILTLEFVID